jgi:hypothetical protein
MNKEDYINKLRLYLADPKGLIWEDSELYAILNDALKQYSNDSGYFVGKFYFFPDKNGKYKFPDDYEKFMLGYNEKGNVINAASAVTLFGRQGKITTRTGSAEYIYNDNSDYGEFALYPIPEDNQNLADIKVSDLYGEMQNNGYGVYQTEEYGTTKDINLFSFAGEIYYHKTGRVEDVKDYMAIIFCALSIAYNTDSDFGNADIALFWKTQYKNRINAFSRIKNYNNGIRQTGIFY